MVKRTPDRTLSMLDVVAFLGDASNSGLLRGQVGTVVELLDNSHVLVEFSDSNGSAFAVEPCSISQLLVLRYEPVAA